MRFAEMEKEELQSLYDSLMTEYIGYKQQGLQLNIEPRQACSRAVRFMRWGQRMPY